MEGQCQVDSFPSVEALSDESETGPIGPAPRKKRKRGHVGQDQKSPQLLVSDEQSVRAMLGKPKCGCKQRCLHQFTDDASFKELMSFRLAWSALHKLDQDNEAPLAWIRILITSFWCPSELPSKIFQQIAYEKGPAKRSTLTYSAIN